jgi:hypothetical protein
MTSISLCLIKKLSKRKTMGIVDLLHSRQQRCLLREVRITAGGSATQWSVVGECGLVRPVAQLQPQGGIAAARKV